MHLNSSLSNSITANLRLSKLICRDDVMVNASTVHDLLIAILAFMDLCLKSILKIHPRKCALFSSETRLCGRAISHEDVCIEPSRMDEIEQMDTPVPSSSFNNLYEQSRG